MLPTVTQTLAQAMLPTVTQTLAQAYSNSNKTLTQAYNAPNSNTNFSSSIQCSQQ